jgi:hypothetical protein
MPDKVRPRTSSAERHDYPRLLAILQFRNFAAVGLDQQAPIDIRSARVVRIILFAVLAVIPPTLIGTLVWKGHTAPPAEHAAASARPSGQEADATLRALFEPPPTGTKIKEKITLYDEKGLFDFIDGAAPIFIDRHFRKLAAAEIATAEGSDLDCAVYDMATPENAQSIFDKEKSVTAKTVDGWPEAIAGPMSFVFHHTRYYAKLTAFDAKAEAALPAVARSLKEKMK